MRNNQDVTRGLGDWPLPADTVHAIEGNAEERVPDQDGRDVQIERSRGLENVTVLAGRQVAWRTLR